MKQNTIIHKIVRKVDLVEYGGRRRLSDSSQGGNGHERIRTEHQRAVDGEKLSSLGKTRDVGARYKPVLEK